MEIEEWQSILKQLKSGHKFMKHKRNGDLSPREFFLDEYEDFLFCYYQKNSGDESCRYHIRNINEVRLGSSTFILNKIAQSEQISSNNRNLKIIIIYNNFRNQLHLIAQNESIRDIWIRGLQYLIKIHLGTVQRHRISDEKWILSHLQFINKGKAQLITKEECRKIVDTCLNVEMSDRRFEDLFQAVNKMHNDQLTSEEFINFFRLATRREDLFNIMQRYVEDSNEKTMETITMTSKQLLRFLIHCQQQSIITTASDDNPEIFETKQIDSLEEVETLINEYEIDVENQKRNLLSLDGFQNLMLSDDFSLMKPWCSHQIYQDMTKPLNHYYINTSHNTYLFDNQLIGESNPEAYNRALRSGCRAVEIDCHDGDQGFPIVKHGYTLVKPCSFEAIIRSIEPNLFVASPYPVILDIENHCSPNQQQKMSKLLKEILGDKLIIQSALNENESFLPSPTDLKYKVILRGVKNLPAPTISRIFFRDNSDDDENSFPSQIKINIEQQFGNMIVYLQNIPYALKDENQNSWQSSSLSERQFERLIQNNSSSLIEQTSKRVIRVYPDGLRQDSSNPNPIDAWNFGVQMVALNHQTKDESMMFYQGKFRDNGSCGYVLKPNYLNSSSMRFNATDYLNQPSNINIDRTYFIQLTVISAQFLSRRKSNNDDISDPYVFITTKGVSCDCHQRKTRFIKNNGLNPIWNETFKFEIYFPQLCLINFEVLDTNKFSRDDCLGYFSLPLTTIQPGYRHIHLRTKDHHPTNSTLFVEISIKEN